MDATGGPEPLFDIEAARLRFESANALAADITDQNNRSQLIDQVTDADLKSIATEWLAVEQQNTLAHLETNAANSLYRALGERFLQLEEEEARASQALLETIEAAKEAINQEVELVIQIAPLGAQRTREIADKKISDLNKGLEEDVLPIGLRSEKIAIDSLFELMSEPWPVPQATTLESIDKSTTEVISEIIDEMPVDLNIGSERAQSDSVKRESHVIYERELTAKVLDFLSTNPGRIISVRELCEAMYSPEVLATMKREDARALITTALGPKVKGAALRKELIERGFVLQYGRRIERIREGDRTQVKIKRIYRTIPVESLNETHIAREGNEDNILWEATPEQVELVQKNSKKDSDSAPVGEEKSEIRVKPNRNVREQILELFVSNLGAEITYEDIAGKVYEDTGKGIKVLVHRLHVLMAIHGETITSELKSRGFDLVLKTIKRPVRVGGHTVRKNARVFICNAIEAETQAENDMSPSIEEDAQPENANQEVTSAEPEQGQSRLEELEPVAQQQKDGASDKTTSESLSWETSFQQEAEQAIISLSELGYIKAGNIMPVLASRNPVATQTILDNMSKAGILSKTKFKAKEIKAADLVMFRVHRNNKSLFRDEKLKTRCEEIIRASLNRHFSELDKQRRTLQEEAAA